MATPSYTEPRIMNPFALIALTISLATTFAITMPFVGVLVRYRANYVPKRVQLVGDDGPVNETGSDIGYFGMMRRVYRIEGWAGLYKGIMPSIINSLIATVVFVPVVVAFAYILPQPSIVYPITILALSLIPVILLVPMLIITNRAITTPHRLAFFAPKIALRVLLSPAERAQPLRLYLAPGVALGAVILALIPTVIFVLRQLLTFRIYPAPGHRHYYPIVLSTSLPALILTTALLTPFQVILTRVTLQRLGPPVAAFGLGEADAVALPAVYAAEDVVDFRTEQAPYMSLLDCGRKIVSEEGRGALFRAWWVTAIFTVIPVLFAPAAAPGVPPGLGHWGVL